MAGTGTRGYSGDGGPATSAQLSNLAGIAVDSSGNLYIADSGNHRIRVSTDGIITTLAGTGTRGYSGDGGPAVSAQLGLLSGIAVDSNGEKIYVAEPEKIPSASFRRCGRQSEGANIIVPEPSRFFEIPIVPHLPWGTGTIR